MNEQLDTIEEPSGIDLDDLDHDFLQGIIDKLIE